jgi:SAM-dependent methyltransferase
MTDTDKSIVDAWTIYWRAGQRASCFVNGVEVRFESTWRDLVDLCGSGSRLLDLACGDGAAARLCAEHAQRQGMDLCVTAVDAAEIPAARAPAPGSITFLGGVRLEALPFPDIMFDAVISQFGFEYADEAAAATEAVRVLRPGGRLRLLMHAEDSAVHRDTAGRQRRLLAALAGDGPVTLVRDLVRAAIKHDTERLADLEARLPSATALLQAIAAGAPQDDSALFYSSEFLRSWRLRERYDPNDLLRSIEEGWTHASGVAIRQGHMLAAARSKTQIDALATRFHRLGLAAARITPVTSAGGQIGWLLDANKPADQAA